MINIKKRKKNKFRDFAKGIKQGTSKVNVYNEHTPFFSKISQSIFRLKANEARTLLKKRRKFRFNVDDFVQDTTSHEPPRPGQARPGPTTS